LLAEASPFLEPRQCHGETRNIAGYTWSTKCPATTVI